ncbi:MAG TPA: hypothetical protein VFI46_09500 [Jiangellaceae bacterium]|nr:hypothetical protein [Jiangellaceae bacterium]
MSTTEPTDREPQLWLLRVAKAVVVLVYAFVLIDLVLLTLGFFLRLFGASTDAEFTRWVYRNVDRVMEPFRGMFPSQALSDQSVLDVSLLFAMIVYAIVGIALHALVEWLTGKIVALRHRQQIASMQRQQTAPTVASPPGAPHAAGYPVSTPPSGFSG